MPNIARRAAAVFLVAHGLAHVLGFIAAWKLGELDDVPYSTLILNGTLDVGDLGIRVVGVLWLAAAIAFLVAAFVVWRRGPTRTVAVLTAFSLAVCLVGLPASIIGVSIDVAILAGLLLVRPSAPRPAFQ